MYQLGKLFITVGFGLPYEEWKLKTLTKAKLSHPGFGLPYEEWKQDNSGKESQTYQQIRTSL